jgi:hypothetical protein
VFDPLDLDALARAIDERVLALPEGNDPARLFGVRLVDGDIHLVQIWSGVGRELPCSVNPPAGLVALVLESGGWAAPMEDDGLFCRPSEHPHRRRMHHSAIVTGDNIDIGVLRVAGEEPQVMRDAVGVMPDRLLECWERRADAA